MFYVKNASFYRKIGANKRQILKNINLCVQEGEVLSILGRNGAGKTTLLKCMVRFLAWSEGESVFLDKPISQYNHKELWQFISYVPQAKMQVFGIKVLDMVALGCNPFVRFKPNAKHLQMAEQTLEELALSHLASKNCANLSGGELQMVLFARALVKNPKLLILDEPESNLDFHNQKIILESLKKLSLNKCSIILNTHFPAHAVYLSHKVLLLHTMQEGMQTNAFFGDAHTILTAENLSKLYGVPLCMQSSYSQDEYILRV